MRVVPALAVAFALEAHAVALTPDEVAAACKDADGLAHCGRMVEEIQLKRLPGLAKRDGTTLDVTLYPSGHTSFTDSDGDAGRAYSLWDYFDALNAVVLYVARGDDASFIVLQRTNGRTFELPAEPRLAPDRQHVATADFCASQCVNEIGLWRIDRQSLRKEASFTPGERWSDAAVQWKSADVLTIEYTREGESQSRTMERRLTDAGWKRVAP
jgi:hypothetical protein